MSCWYCDPVSCPFSLNGHTYDTAEPEDKPVACQRCDAHWNGREWHGATLSFVASMKTPAVKSCD